MKDFKPLSLTAYERLQFLQFLKTPPCLSRPQEFWVRSRSSRSSWSTLTFSLSTWPLLGLKSFCGKYSYFPSGLHFLGPAERKPSTTQIKGINLWKIPSVFTFPTGGFSSNREAAGAIKKKLKENYFFFLYRHLEKKAHIASVDVAMLDETHSNLLK